MKVRILSAEFDGAKIADWPALPSADATIILHETGTETKFTVQSTRWHLGSEGALIEVEVLLTKLPEVTSASLQMLG